MLLGGIPFLFPFPGQNNTNQNVCYIVSSPKGRKERYENSKHGIQRSEHSILYHRLDHGGSSAEYAISVDFLCPRDACLPRLDHRDEFGNA